MTPPPRNPLARLIAVVVAVIALAAAFTLGLVAIAVVVGLGLLLGMAAWIRNRFFARKRPGRQGQPGHGQDSTSPKIIEAEYTVVSREGKSARRGDDKN